MSFMSRSHWSVPQYGIRTICAGSSPRMRGFVVFACAVLSAWEDRHRLLFLPVARAKGSCASCPRAAVGGSAPPPTAAAVAGPAVHRSRFRAPQPAAFGLGAATVAALAVLAGRGRALLTVSGNAAAARRVRAFQFQKTCAPLRDLQLQILESTNGEIWYIARDDRLYDLDFLR